jgi:hypothetical protein
MTIEEYKQKLDEYLGITGEIELLEDARFSTTYLILYKSPSGVPMIKYSLVRSKLGKNAESQGGWYESGSRTNPLPDFDPDTVARRQHWLKIREEQIRTGT